MKTIIISAFPGVGKSYLFDNKPTTIGEILDSDSSTFDKKDFPNNYLDHIESNIGKVDIILVSSHEDVRNGLIERNIPFELVYPHPDLYSQYMTRYKERGSSESFISLLSSMWDTWIMQLDSCQILGRKYMLGLGSYLSDILPDIIKMHEVNLPIIGEEYMHFKGGIYIVLFNAINTSSGDIDVVYQSVVTKKVSDVGLIRKFLRWIY